MDLDHEELRREQRGGARMLVSALVLGVPSFLALAYIAVHVGRIAEQIARAVWPR